jgi:pyrimidine-nucleoside phosphorylase
MMLLLGKKANSIVEARKILIDKIESGAALNKLAEMVEAQHGNPEQIRNTELLPKAANIIEVKSIASGYVKSINAEDIGISALILGAGRETKDTHIDHAVGIVLGKKVGEYVAEGDTIATIHANDMSMINDCTRKLLDAYSYTEVKPEVRPLIFGMVDEKGTNKYI